MNRIKRMAMVAISILMLTSNAISVFASEGDIEVKGSELGSSLEDKGSLNYKSVTTVKYTQEAYDYSIIVNIPKDVVIPETREVGYSVSVSGTASENTMVTVEPVDENAELEGTNFAMSTEGKADVWTVVTQGDTVWSYSEIMSATEKSGNISAEDLTRGTWQGTLNFNISVGTHTHSYAEEVTKSATCTETGVKTFTCDCGDVYTEDIPLADHSYVKGVCSECGGIDTSYTDEELQNWNYEVSGDVVTLKSYKESTTDNFDIVVHSSYVVNGKTCKAQFPADSTGLFSYSKASSITFDSDFDTSNVTNMFRMFADLSNATSLDLSCFNTANVTDMTAMFTGSTKLTSIVGLDSFNTSNVTSMSSMFNRCKGITGLNLSSFNTLKVTNMSSMFQACDNLVSLDLRSFDTHNVADMGQMFAYSYKLTSILGTSGKWVQPTGEWDTYEMFETCGTKAVTLQ